MNKIYFTLTLIFVANFLIAQEIFEEVSVGTSYTNTAFYNLSDGTTTTISHTEWDMAFTTSPGGAGVFINEANTSVAPAVEIYLTSSTDFASVDTTGMERIYNDENSWEAGAFNLVGDDTNPFDFGWGSYSTETNTVTATRFFAIKLRDGSYKKLEIQSLISGEYTFRYADVDGSNETTQTVTKSDYSNKTLAYFSFASEEVLDLEPANWDMMFTRYYTSIFDGTSNVNYPVTGVLTNASVQVAEVGGVDPETVDAADYENDYSTELDIFGHDWKSIDLATFSWNIPADLVYFVKTQEGELYKVRFIDFTGSSSGITTLGRTYLGDVVASVENEVAKAAHNFTVYPNPTTDFISINFTNNALTSDGKVFIFNILGQIVQAENFFATTGENTISLSLDLPQGAYTVVLQSGKMTSTEMILVK